MKIWAITQYYKPQQSASAERIASLAKYWMAENHSVEVFCGTALKPDGNRYDAYQGRPPFMKEMMDGILIRRHWVLPSGSEKLTSRLLNQLSFAISVLLKNLNHRFESKPDMIMVVSPSIFAALAAWLLAKRYGVPCIMEVRELWPKLLVDTGLLREESRLFPLLSRLEKSLYRRMDALVALTVGAAHHIAASGGDKKRIFIIPNGIEDTDFDVATRAAHDGSAEKLRTELQINPLTKVVLYLGHHGSDQALGQLVDTARLMMARSDILFLLAGDGPDKERLKRIARGMPNIQFVPMNDRNDMWAFYTLAYVCITPLRNIAAFDAVIPPRIFEIMAAGRAQIGCLKGEPAQILEKSQSALVIPPEDPERLARAITTLTENPDRTKEMGQKGRTFAAEFYRQTRFARNYLAIMHKTLNERR